MVTALFHTILVPYDFSRHADRALDTAVRLARPSKGRVLLLHVVPPLPGLPAGISRGDVVVNLHRALEAVADLTAAHRALRVESRVCEGNPVERILEVAREADSIVMGTLGRTGIDRILFGSVAEKVVRKAPCPVLVVKRDERDFVMP